MKLKDMKISTQLRIGMGAILVFVAILGATAWFQADDLWQETKGLYEHPLQVRRALNTLAINILTMHRDMKDLVMADNEQERQSIIQAIDTNEANATRQFDILYDRYLGPREDIDEIRTAFVSWKPIRTETIRLLRAGKTTEALRRTKVSGSGGGQVENLLNEIQHMINFARDKADKFYADARHTKDSLIMQMWIVFGASLLLTLGVSYILLKNIKDPLRELTSLTEQFGQGKLDVRSRYVSANEFGNLAASFNALAATIQTEWLNKESSARLMEELHESNAYLENLIDYANAPIIVWNPQFRITRFNHAFENLTGLTVEEVLGKEIDLLFPEERRDECLKYVRQATEGEHWEVIEIPILHRNGSVRTVLWNSATIYSPDSKTAIATIAQGQDITDRKRTEEELRESNERLSMSLEVGNTGVWRWYLKSDEVHFDDRFHTILGYTPGELPSTLQEWLPYHHPDDIPVWMPKANSYLRGESSIYESEHRIRNKAGTWSWIFTRGKLVNQSTKGSQGQFVGTAMDITERKRAEELLNVRLRIASTANTKSSKEIMQMTLDEIEAQIGSTIGFYHFLMEDQETLSLQTWSTNTLRNMCTAEGGGSHYPISKAGVWVECIHEKRPVIHNDYDSLLHRKGMPSGHAKIIRELVVPIFRGERIVAIVGVGNKSTDYNNTDIDIISHLGDFSWEVIERKQAEEKVKVSLQEKETLLREIHHRVKNNLQIISSLLNLQARSIGNEKLEGIFRESQDRITAMASVHSLLYKSQNFAEINFGEYLRETASQLFRSYKTSSAVISLVIHAENVMLPIDTAIPCGLIINELITNTLKYAFPGARKGEIKIEMNRTENGIRLHYEDNGIGFPKDVDFCSTQTLGLKLVHMFVKQLDGSIEQDTNSGTRYVIMFKTGTLQEI